MSLFGHALFNYNPPMSNIRPLSRSALGGRGLNLTLEDIQLRHLRSTTMIHRYFLFIADYYVPKIVSCTFVQMPPKICLLCTISTTIHVQDPRSSHRGPGCPLSAGLPGRLLRHRDEGPGVQPRLPPRGQRLRRLDDQLPGKQILEKPHGQFNLILTFYFYKSC